MDKLWEELQGMGLVFAKHGSVEFNTWAKRLAFLNDDELKRGLEECEKHTKDKGWLNLPTFLQYCKLPRPYSPPPLPPVKNINEMIERSGPRFRDLMKVTMAMLDEGPEGPITLATRDNRLTKEFIEGKAADEIIASCEKLYG